MAADLGFPAATRGAVAVSAALVGASVGSLAAGQAADALGPGRALLLNNLFLILGSLLAFGTPFGFWGLLAGVLSLSSATVAPLGICRLHVHSTVQAPGDNSRAVCSAVPACIWNGTISALIKTIAEIDLHARQTLLRSGGRRGIAVCPKVPHRDCASQDSWHPLLPESGAHMLPSTRQHLWQAPGMCASQLPQQAQCELHGGFASSNRGVAVTGR